MELFECVGVIHVHSRYSDGGGSVKGIIKAARKAGLDFLILTDHDTLKPRRKWQGWHGDLLLIVDEEVSPWIGNHLLALGIKEAIEAKRALRAQPIIDEVKRQGGLALLAHPFGGKENFLPVRDRPWLDWEADGFDGMEIWSYMYDWVERINLLNLPYYYLHPEEAIEGPHPEALRKWDELGKERRVVGIAGLDAHGKRVPFLPFIQILPYEYLFKTLRNHLLLTEPLDRSSAERSIRLIYEAIGEGRCFVGYDLLADSSGFSFRCEMEGEEVVMGEEREFKGRATLIVSSPFPARIRLLRDGEEMCRRVGTELRWEATEPGVYRVELYLGEKPWVFSNPIYLRGRPEASP